MAPRKRNEPLAWEEAFLTGLRNSANVRAACEAAGVSRQAAYKRRDGNVRFRDEWNSAIDEACDLLEYVARKRAMESSDTLIIFLLKAHRPALYHDRLRIDVHNEAERLLRDLGMDPTPEAVGQVIDLAKERERRTG